MNEIRLAMDSSREKTKEGFLRVGVSNISKAGVNEYRGSDIPAYVELGLEDDGVYSVFRPPDQLEESVDSFKMVPLLYGHKPFDPFDPPKEMVIGTIGSDVFWDGRYLKADLLVSDADAIQEIENEERMELSAGYHFVPLLKNGTYEGKEYTIMMTNITGNHVALVKHGRAGSDVVVGDEKTIFKGGKNMSLREELTRCLVEDRHILYDIFEKVDIPDKEVFVEKLVEKYDTIENKEDIFEFSDMVEEKTKDLEDDLRGEIYDVLKRELTNKFKSFSIGDEKEIEIERVVEDNEDKAKSNLAMDGDFVKKRLKMSDDVKRLVARELAVANELQNRRRIARDEVSHEVGYFDHIGMDSADDIYSYGLSCVGMKGFNKYESEALWRGYLFSKKTSASDCVPLAMDSGVSGQDKKLSGLFDSSTLDRLNKITKEANDG